MRTSIALQPRATETPAPDQFEPLSAGATFGTYTFTSASAYGQNESELGHVPVVVPRVGKSIAMRSLVSWLSPVRVAARVKQLLDSCYVPSATLLSHR